MPGLQTLLRRVAIDLTPLRGPHYRRLWAGQGLSFIGFQLTTVAVNLQVYDITSSSLWVGMLGLANLVPLVVFGLWGGAVADVMDRRRCSSPARSSPGSPRSRCCCRRGCGSTTCT